MLYRGVDRLSLSAESVTWLVRLVRRFSSLVACRFEDLTLRNQGLGLTRVEDDSPDVAQVESYSVTNVKPQEWRRT